ncbi:MAG: biotin/lipoyl-binding protein, partial [Alphaproteobacteria bacterium]|nr:biotin/lipoyl-binding protein [Alphaproteobacteria bacterium]
MKREPAKRTRSESAREKQLRYLSQSVRLEEAVHPRLIHMTLVSVTVAVVSFVAWAGFTNINEVARAPGEIVPRGFQQVVQHFDGGIIKNIATTEGMMVKEGDILMTLDGAGTQQDLERALKQQTTLRLQRERLRAFVEDRRPDFTKIAGANADMMAEQEKIFASMIESRAKEHDIIKDQITQKKHAINILEARRGTAWQNVKLMQDMH